MRVFKNKAFARWATREGLSDELLWRAVREMERGLHDADLGGHVYKKRVAIKQQGKRGGARTLLAYRSEKCAFFIYGFAKNVRANIRTDELRALKTYARILLNFSTKDLRNAVVSGVLIEVYKDG